MTPRTPSPPPPPLLPGATEAERRAWELELQIARARLAAPGDIEVMLWPAVAAAGAILLVLALLIAAIFAAANREPSPETKAAIERGRAEMEWRRDNREAIAECIRASGARYHDCAWAMYQLRGAPR